MITPPRFYRSRLLFNDFQKFLELNYKEFGDLYKYKGLLDFYFIQDTEEVKKVLLATNKIYSKNTPLVKKFHNIIGNSILLSEQEVWKPRRKLMNPSFTKKNSLSLVSLIKVKISELIEDINTDLSKENEKVYDFASILNKLILNIIGKAYFNKSFNDDFKEIEQLLEELRDYIEKPPLPFFSNPDVPTLGNLKMKKKRKKLLDFVARFIKERETSSTSYDDLLSRIMDSMTNDPNSNMNDDDLVIEILTLILAGHETTANTLCYIFNFLTQHPNKYNKLQEEIDKYIGTDENASSMKIMGLEYLDCVIKESMRLMPSVWLLTRRNLEELELNGERIKKNSTFICSPLLIHKDERLWEQANDFIPERFLPENKDKIQPDSYMPFGAGQRICIGAQLAMIEMKMIMVMLLQQFQFSKCEGFVPKLKYSVTTYSRNGYKFKVQKRN